MPSPCIASGAGSSLENNPREGPAERIANEPAVTLAVADTVTGAVRAAAETPGGDGSPTAGRGISSGVRTDKAKGS